MMSLARHLNLNPNFNPNLNLNFNFNTNILTRHSHIPLFIGIGEQKIYLTP